MNITNRKYKINLGLFLFIFLSIFISSSVNCASISELIMNLESNSQDVQKTSISELIKIGVPAVVPLAEALKNSKSLITRNNAAIILGEIKDDSAVNSLIDSLSDNESIVRISAIKSLGKINNKKAVEPLIMNLLNEENDEVRIALLKVLIEFKDRQFMRPLLSLLKDSNNDIRLYAIIGLGELNDSTLANPLIPFLKDKNKDIRLNTAKALGKSNSKKAVKPLIEALKDNSISVQLEVITALKTIKDPSAVEPLINAFNGYYSNMLKVENDLFELSTNKVVYDSIFIKSFNLLKKSSVEALSEIADNRANETFLDALRDENKDIKLAAIKALAKTKDINAFELLIHELKNTNNDIRKNSIKTLGEYSNQKSFKYLVDALKDREIAVQAVAIEALGKLKNKNAYIYIINFLPHTNKNIQDITEQALMKITDEDFGHDFEAWMNWWEDELIKAKIVKDKDKSEFKNSSIKFFLNNLQFFSEEEEKGRFISFIIKWKNDYKKVMESQFINMLEDKNNGYEFALKFIALQEKYKKEIIDMSHNRFKDELLIEEPLKNLGITLKNGKKIKIINYWHGLFCSGINECNSILYFYSETSFLSIANQNINNYFNFLIVDDKYIQFFVQKESSTGSTWKEKWIYDIPQHKIKMILSYIESNWSMQNGTFYEIYSFLDQTNNEKLGDITTYYREEFPLLANNVSHSVSSPYFLMKKYSYDEKKGIYILADSQKFENEKFLEKAVMIFSKDGGLDNVNSLKFDELIVLFRDFFDYNYKGANYLLDVYQKSNEIVQKAVLLVFYRRLIDDMFWAYSKTIVDSHIMQKKIFKELNSSGYLIPADTNVINISGKWIFCTYENNNEICGQELIFLQTGTKLTISDYPLNKFRLYGKIIDDNAIIDLIEFPDKRLQRTTIKGRIHDNLIDGMSMEKNLIWRFRRVQ